jgi:cytidine deaminase
MTDAAVVAAIDARAYAARAGLDDDALLRSLLPWASSFADAPVSGFIVRAVGRGRTGNVYAGGNLEFAGLPLSASVHAEQAVVVNAWLHGETALEALAVSAVPCGHCRQFLGELAGASAVRVLLPDGTAFGLAELLPHAFGPADLGVTGRLLEPETHGLTLAPAAGSPTAAAALAAADASYAPYTGAYAGLALGLADGGTVAGRYAECAAFNPSLPALQAALTVLALRRIPRERVVEAVLVEAGARSSQRSAAESSLAAFTGIALGYRRADTNPG